MFSSIRYFWSEALKSLFRNRFMTIASILTVTLSMFILGMFLCVVFNIDHAATYLESQVEMSIYLKEDLTTPQVMEVGKHLKALPGVESVSFVNKDEALAQFKEQLGEQAGILEAVNGNPLPASYSLSFDTPTHLKQAAVIVSEYKAVESVQYGQDIIEQLYKVAQFIRIAGAVIIVFLAGAELFIISNTIRLTVFARRREIQIMKYVGATNGFIRWPFIYEGVVIGIIGSGIASIFIWEGYQLVLAKINEAGLVFLPLMRVYPFMMYIVLSLLIAGVFIGALGSAISLRKYMKV
ncbi:permease-like cell division protein FtsX [Dialister pneumosintes]|jgi:Cell division protein|uniref:Cell division protein FtsX n=1 Tax=Dialister pneumosintes TaxID=39950 RepID=A0A1B3WD49_9FIRM|nr:permease-like cell division protein FtsX [Dialister pneumosintes]AOH38895.1 cell division protein FtsX [Dialister pneumosintes]MBS6479960.1 permease-like cell division protein FtsX [Dialister sp.]RID94143.1 ABC transporter permease [Dialister pneumosintes]CDF27828.1 cell division protein FtsX [Dialister sp. CAG:588]